MMLPDGWKRFPLHEIAEVRTGLAKGKTGQRDPVELPYLRVANVQDGHLDLTEIKTISVERGQIERYSLRYGDILMTEGGDFDKLGRGDVWQSLIEPCLHQNHVFAVRPQFERIDPFFLTALTSSHYGRTYFLSCAKRSTNLASINSTQLKSFPVLVPPLQEQKRIAGILRVWDEAIFKAEKLLANSRMRKQELMRGLLSGKRRFNHPQGKWLHLDFDELFERVTRKNKIGNTNVLTISGQGGLINQRAYFNKSVASENLASYTLVERNEFAYNKSYSAGYPMGAIKPLLAYDMGVVSSLYICFRIKDGVDADFHFFRHYFEAGLLNEEISGIAQEGARNHGLLNVGVGDFFKLRLHVPSLPVQSKIAEAINVAEAEVHSIEQQLERFQIEKRALMQQLLSGKRRVKLEEPIKEASAA